MSAAKPSQTESGQNRRIYVRQACGETTAAHVALQESCIFQPVKVLDVSAGGIALLLWEPLTQGDEVFVQLTNRNNDLTHEIAARVANVRQRRNGKWAIGFSFERPLDAAELAQFL